MCGFAGFLSYANYTREDMESRAESMAFALRDRGPDDRGIWLDPLNGIALSHRRLSIVDLSQSGHQPMRSKGGRFVIAFNGEIYNHAELRLQLEANSLIKFSWVGRSDTEVLLAGFEAWGIKETLEKLVGMFAFGLWDSHANILYLGRDRVGEKPLYYGWQNSYRGRTFFFGSELKALKANNAFIPNISRYALDLFTRHGYIPSPDSIYEDIYKLEPGTFLAVSLADPIVKISPYWSAISVANGGLMAPFDGNKEAAVDALDFLLNRAVGQQMIADVPVGAFLSGGTDSSMISALMQAQASNPIKTFTIGFDEQDYSEAKHAAAIAKFLGTDHTELVVSPKIALEAITALPTVYCEPFADSSQIPTLLLAQLTSNSVSVVLSGDGGDELFCGYNRYVLSHKIWGLISRGNPTLRAFIARQIIDIAPEKWDLLNGRLKHLLPERFHYKNIGDKLHKAAEILNSATWQDMYLSFTSHWRGADALVIGGGNDITKLHNQSNFSTNLDFVDRMMLLDLLTYLPDDILTKVDRACMKFSLEGRMPFLDHRIIEFAWSLPQEYKLNKGVGKWVVKKLLERYLPKGLTDRPKMGFGVPIADWLRGPLRPWAENLLDESRLLREGYFHPTPIRKKWLEHLSGKRNWQHQLWNVLMFQAWLEGQ